MLSDDELASLIRHARVLPLDIVKAKGNGHGGTAVSLAPVLTTLFQRVLRHDPADPHWLGRDRFVLSAGHTSLSLYLQLFLSGYGLELDDLKKARQLGSLTPGHPELGHTNGVETTTGPLGQGFANAVGMALEGRRLEALFPGDPSLFHATVFTLVSDGDLMEGISHEAGSLAGHLRLGKLVAIWDDNEVNIEGSTRLVTSEDVALRFEAYGWHIVEVEDAEDTTRLERILTEARDRAATDAPTFIRLRTTIGYPMPTFAGTSNAHAGIPDDAEVRGTKEALGLDPDAEFHLPDDLLAAARRVGERGAAAHRAWDERFATWRAHTDPDTVALLDRLVAHDLPDDIWDGLPDLGGDKLATRQASNKILAALGERLPELWGGSADLTDTAGARLTKSENLLAPGDATGLPGGVGGKQIHFGIREHAMGSIANGIAISGLTRPFTNTYLAFADYMRPSLRMAALMGIDTIFLFSHDSVAVGEDGPTHQPVEQTESLRLIPHLAVARPADNAEVAAVWKRALSRREGPTAMIFSRQALPQLEADPDGALRGGYVVRDGDDVVLLATGSEVSLAVAAADELAGEGVSARVVSVPCQEWFDAEPAEYRDEVLPPAIRARVSVEAGVGSGWYRYGVRRAVSVEDFGESGNGAKVLERAGVNLAAVVQAARDAIADD